MPDTEPMPDTDFLDELDQPYRGFPRRRAHAAKGKRRDRSIQTTVWISWASPVTTRKRPFPTLAIH